MKTTKTLVLPLLSPHTEEKERQSLFTGLSATEWAAHTSGQPAPCKLIEHVWNQHEICLMFGPPNTGKSVFAVEQAHYLSQQSTILYIDFKLSGKQFVERYSSNFKDYFPFHPNFRRLEFNPSSSIWDHHDPNAALMQELEAAVIALDAKVIFIDDLSCLPHSTMRHSAALRMMITLKMLRSRLGISAMVLINTPARVLSRHMSQNDLAAHRHLLDYCDTALGFSDSVKERGLNYIKHIKSTNAPICFDSENVNAMRITKDCNFLRISYLGFSDEGEHLAGAFIKEKNKEEVVKRVKQLDCLGYSQRQIAATVNISVSTVNKYLNL